MGRLGKRQREARKRHKSRTVITFSIGGSEEKRLKLGKRKLAEWGKWRRFQGGGLTSYR